MAFTDAEIRDEFNATTQGEDVDQLVFNFCLRIQDLRAEYHRTHNRREYFRERDANRGPRRKGPRRGLQRLEGRAVEKRSRTKRKNLRSHIMARAAARG